LSIILLKVAAPGASPHLASEKLIDFKERNLNYDKRKNIIDHFLFFPVCRFIDSLGNNETRSFV
jgi:hypothetical protein